jgi:hypothetical protein
MILLTRRLSSWFEAFFSPDFDKFLLRLSLTRNSTICSLSKAQQDRSRAPLSAEHEQEYQKARVRTSGGGSLERSILEDPFGAWHTGLSCIELAGNSNGACRCFENGLSNMMRVPAMVQYDMQVAHRI